MRAGRGAVVVLTVGLVLAVAVPGGAPSAATPATQQIVSAVAAGSTLTMPSGYTQYFYVGGSSSGAQISNISYQPVASASCSPEDNQLAPVGGTRPAAPHASFTTSGSVAVLAGVATSGYGSSFRHESEGEATRADCDAHLRTGSRQRVGAGLNTGSVGGEALVLASTMGIGNLQVSLPAKDNTQCQTTGPLVTLQNVTASQGPTEGGAAAVYSLAMGPNSSCFVQLDGTSYNTPGPGNVVATLVTFMLYPKAS